MLDMVNTDFVSAEEAEIVLGAWERSRDVPSDWLPSSELNTRPRTSFGVQMRVLLRKLLLLLLRDPVMYTMRLSLFAVVSSFFSALYIDSRSRTQEQ
eukprot:7265637-Prymnesium_polylepis.1